MKKRYYLAYGSNLNLRQMRWRCPTAELVGYTYLHRMRLVFRGSGSGFYLSIDPAPDTPGAVVPCGVFEVTAQDEQALDIYEGFPSFYTKVEFKGLPLCDLSDDHLIKSSINGFAYALPSTAPFGRPSRGYYETCMEGYRDFGFYGGYLVAALKDALRRVKHG